MIYEYKFKEKGKYIILFLFHKLISTTNCLFNNCSSLNSLNLSNFNTNNVKYMSFMFCNCSSLNSLNLSNFNTNNVTDMNNMFEQIQKSCKIIENDNKIKSELKQTKYYSYCNFF